MVCDWPLRDDLAVSQGRDTVASTVEAVQVVRHHEDREPKRALERQDEIVELGGRDRVEAGSRLVEEHDLGIEGQRARQGHALGHAAGKLGGELAAIRGLEAHHFELGGGNLIHQPFRQLEVFPHGKLHVLPRGERGEQRALLEQDAPPPLNGAELVLCRFFPVDSESFDAAAPPGQQADDGSHQHGLAAARAADHAQDFAPVDIERNAL